MFVDKKISPIDVVKWYAVMEIDQVSSTKVDRWDIPSRDDDIISTKKNVVSSVTSRSLADAAKNLEELRLSIFSFDGCALKNSAKNTVFADGVPESKIMLIGEAPGSSEDEQGIPFCGASGQLLDNMISSIGLSRKKNVYITNTIFWRPPANRRPTNEEIEICKPFLEKHIAIINPDLLILVGATAVSSLLGEHLQISKIRQEYYQYSNQYLEKPIATTALFHPAYLLRQPLQKKTTWYDLLKVQEFLTSRQNH
jgi:uracil-DNA glycosylase family 4